MSNYIARIIAMALLAMLGAASVIYIFVRLV